MLERSITELYSPACRVQFCDDWCKADAKKFSRTSTITKVIDERRFEDTNLTKSDGYYKHGVVKFFGLAAHTEFEDVVKEYKNKAATLFSSPHTKFLPEINIRYLQVAIKHFQRAKTNLTIL